MDVSVIIPTRNRRALLATTLRSVLRQRDVDLEVIVVDDASIDDTGALLAALADPRVRVIRHDSCQGVSAARNHGIAEAKAEWIAFLDDDDLWAPDKLALQLGAARESGADWVYVGHVHINMNHQVTGGAPPLDPDEVLRQLPKSDVVPGGCSGVDRVETSAGSRRRLRYSLPFIGRLGSLAAACRCGMPAWVCRPLVGYRLHGQQMSLDASRILAEFRMLAQHNQDANRALLYRYLGWWALRVGNYRACSEILRAGWLGAAGRVSATRLLATDVAAWAQEIVNRLGMARVRLSRPAPLSDEEQSWRDAGQAWVDELMQRHSR